MSKTDRPPILRFLILFVILLITAAILVMISAGDEPTNRTGGAAQATPPVTLPVSPSPPG